MNNLIVIINFSHRDNGNCIAVADAIREYHDRSILAEYKIDHDWLQSCGNCDYECLRESCVCPNRTQLFDEMLNQISNCDVAYYIVPNYCGFPCANYFAFNERSVGYFERKKERLEKYLSTEKRFVIISNSESEVFEKAMHQQTKDRPKMLYLKTGKYAKNSIAGDLMDSDAAKADLVNWLFRLDQP